MTKEEKIEIINYYDKNDFREFLENDYNSKILELLDNEGLDILNRSPIKLDRMCYILEFSPYRNELFKSDKFLDFFFRTDTDKYYAVLDKLDFNSCDLIMNRAFELDIVDYVIARLFNYFSTEYKLAVLKKWPYSEKLLYCVMEGASNEVLKSIIENYNIDLTKYNVNVERMFDTFKKLSCKNYRKRNHGELKSIVDIDYPSRMFHENLANYIWNNYDIYKVRMLINDSEFFTDSSTMNDYIRNEENKIINNYDGSMLIPPFNELYDKFYSMMEAYNNSLDDYYDYRREYIKIIERIDDDNLYDELKNKYDEGGYQLVKQYLQELCNKCISNYVIDYNFQENYYNVMIDLRELLYFYDSGNLDISLERIEIYRKILNIDSLSINEKKGLHEFLSKHDLVKIFYEDMSFARKVVGSAIKDYSLTKDKLEDYKDEKLSKDYGVPVYKMNNKPFFGLVKSGIHKISDLPSGYSYSLVGNNGLATFGDLTYLYDSSDLNPEQIVHVFPYDSFTNYHPFDNMEEATDRIYTLMMPDELVGSAPHNYNELLILESGNKNTDIDKSIPKLKQIALYCVDKITDNDIENAKDKGLGIILVSASECKIEDSVSDKYRHVDRFDYNYFKYDKRSEFEIKR